MAVSRNAWMQSKVVLNHKKFTSSKKILYLLTKAMRFSFFEIGSCFIWAKQEQFNALQVCSSYSCFLLNLLFAGRPLPPAQVTSAKRTSSSGSVQSSQSQLYPSSPNIPKHIRSKTYSAASSSQMCPKQPKEPYYFILEPESTNPSKPNLSRAPTAQVTYPSARRSSSISIPTRTSDAAHRDLSQHGKLELPKTEGSSPRAQYSVVLKSIARPGPQKEKRVEEDEDRDQTPPPLTKRIASSELVGGTAASTPHEEGSSSVVIKPPEDNTSVFNPIQPPQGLSNGRPTETSPSDTLEASSTSAFEPINKSGRILRTTSLPAGPRPNVQNRHGKAGTRWFLAILFMARGVGVSTRCCVSFVHYFPPSLLSLPKWKVCRGHFCFYLHTLVKALHALVHTDKDFISSTESLYKHTHTSSLSQIFGAN